MTKKNKKDFIISVGGSLLLNAQGLDYRFIKKFRDFIVSQVATGKRFYLVVGGGLTARSYIQAALKIGPVKAIDRDWVGIQATRLNAELLRAIFGVAAYSKVIIDYQISLNLHRSIIVTAGYQPGFSTDHCAVLLARRQGIDTIINLSNIDYVYDQNPRTCAQAHPLSEMSWVQFRKIVGNRWQPGLSLPFDPVAARTSQKYGLKVVILNGKNLSNLSQYLHNQPFKGTVIM